MADPSGHNPGDNYMEQYYLYENDYAQVGDYGSISGGTPPESITDKISYAVDTLSENAKETMHDINTGINDLLITADDILDEMVLLSAMAGVETIRNIETTVNGILPEVAFAEGIMSEVGAGFGKESEKGRISDTRGNYAKYISAGNEIIIGTSASTMKTRSIIFTNIHNFNGEYIKGGAGGGYLIAGGAVDITWSHDLSRSVMDSLKNKPTAITFAYGGSVGSNWNVHGSQGNLQYIPSSVGNYWDDYESWIWKAATKVRSSWDPR